MKISMTAENITLRLKRVSQLRKLCLSLSKSKQNNSNSNKSISKHNSK